MCVLKGPAFLHALEYKQTLSTDLRAVLSVSNIMAKDTNFIELQSADRTSSETLPILKYCAAVTKFIENVLGISQKGPFLSLDALAVDIRDLNYMMHMRCWNRSKKEWVSRHFKSFGASKLHICFDQQT